jgi:hypothetical protein
VNTSPPFFGSQKKLIAAQSVHIKQGYIGDAQTRVDKYPDEVSGVLTRPDTFTPAVRP